MLREEKPWQMKRNRTDMCTDLEMRENLAFQKNRVNGRAV